MTENELLDEIANELKLEKRLPGDVSAYDLAEATGLTHRWCENVLSEKASKGQLVKIKVRSKKGRPINVYRKVK